MLLFSVRGASRTPLAILTLALGVGGVAAAPASAAGRTFAPPALSVGPAQRVAPPVPLQQAPLMGSNPTAYSTNWSGYAVTASSSFNQVFTNYVQPTVTCPVAGAWTVFWVGLDGFTTPTVEQDGTAAYCPAAGSAPEYFAWWEMYPTNYITSMPLTINPGDSIGAAVNYTASTKKYTLTVHDVTSGKTYSQVATCATNLTCARQSAEWVDERPSVGSTLTPLADWNTMSLSNDKASDSTKVVVVNKHNTVVPVPKPVSAYNNTPMDMVNSNFTLLATVGPLSASGTSFTDTWLAAQ